MCVPRPSPPTPLPGGVPSNGGGVAALNLVCDAKDDGGECPGVDAVECTTKGESCAFGVSPWDPSSSRELLTQHSTLNYSCWVGLGKSFKWCSTEKVYGGSGNKGAREGY